MTITAPTNDISSRRYWAFISYSSKDSKTGEWLHRRLESYPIPAELRGMEIFDGAVLGKNLRPIFRDRDELSGSADLGPAILTALRDSRFLIVICSPNSARSTWVNKEILDFKSLHPENTKRILALILSGEPNATSNPGMDDALECFPPALRYPEEPLAGDLRSEGDGKERGFLKILAGIVQLDFDKLYRRHERQLKRRRMIAGAIAGALILVLSGLTAFAFIQRGEARKQADLAIRQRTETQRTMATGFLRSIGQSRGEKLSGAEEAALLELASVTKADVAVREEFIRRIFGEPDFCRRLLARSGMVIHAAIGFNPSLSGQLSQRARAVLADGTTRQLQREAALFTLVHLAQTPADLSPVCSELTTWLAASQSTYPMILAAEIAEAMPVQPTAEDARGLARALTDCIRKSGSTKNENQLARMFVVLAPSLDAKTADDAVAALLDRMLPAISQLTLDPLGAAVAALTPRLSPERKEYLVGSLAAILTSDPNANRVNAAGAAFNALAPSLSAEQARAVSSRLPVSAAGRTSLHGLLVGAAFSSLDGIDSGLLEKSTLQFIDLWAATPDPLETQAFHFGLSRLLEKAEERSRPVIVKHLMERISSSAPALRAHRQAVIGIIAERAGNECLIPYLSNLLDFHIDTENYSERISMMETLLRLIRGENIPRKEEAISALLANAEKIPDASFKELFVSSLSPPANAPEDAEARFRSEIDQILDPKYGRSPSAPTGLRILDDGTPRGLSGWDAKLDRSRADGGTLSASANPAISPPEPPDDFSHLPSLAQTLDTALVEDARRRIHAAIPTCVELRIACRMVAAALALDPSMSAEQAERIAERLLELSKTDAQARYISQTIPLFGGLMPKLRGAALDRVVSQLLELVAGGYAVSSGAELRQAIFAADERTDPAAITVALLATFHGETSDFLDPWLSPLLKSMPAEDIANLLKAPFCIGEARDICQAALQERLGHPPSTPDPATFLRLATAAGHDMSSPWRMIRK